MTEKEEITLTAKQQKQMEVLIRLLNGLINNEEAARQLSMSVRQIKRKKKAYQEQGIASLIHKNRGKHSNNAFPEEFDKRILDLYKYEYNGWNFSHFRDVLEEEQRIKVSETFIYNLMTKNGIKSPNRKRRKKGRSHPPRPRRENAGELIQVDASKHQWLYGTEEYYYLHGAIDDATGIVTACYMMKQETALGYQILMRDTIQRYGIPEELYSDYRTVFQTNKRLTLEETLEGKRLEATKFAEMLKRIGVGIHSTVDPRAKGRIERLWRSFQDRLVKELAKCKIGTIKEANEYINNTFLPKYNAKFASAIDYNKNRFIKVPKNFNYNRELALCYRHKVLEYCFIKHQKTYYKIYKKKEAVSIRTRGAVNVLQGLYGKYYLEHMGSWYDLKPIERVEKPHTENPLSLLTPNRVKL